MYKYIGSYILLLLASQNTLSAAEAPSKPPPPQAAEELSSISDVQQKVTGYIEQFKQQYNIHTLPSIDITEANTIAVFVQKTKIYYQSLLAIRKLHDRYKGDNRKYFSEKNDDNESWTDVYLDIDERLTCLDKEAEKNLALFNLTCKVKTLLADEVIDLEVLNSFLTEIAPKNNSYQLEIQILRKKLNLFPKEGWIHIYWQWEA